MAALDLDDAVVRAPLDGVVSRMRLQPGEWLEEGEPAFSIINPATTWIEANLKETQLEHVEVGQQVEIEVDAYPEALWLGEVASISPATGAEFALIPPQNATGNWVKVVQRLPVRIAVAPGRGSAAAARRDDRDRLDRHRARAEARPTDQRRGRGGPGRGLTAAAAAAAPRTALERALILVSVILATTLYATTLTIANVALPQMQGDLSASIDQIAWVLTFNIVATAIATPPTGWLAARLGRKRLLVGAVSGFTVSTVLCGLASSLPELILWRTCQGLFGAPLVPLSQAITLDTFPKRQHGTAMALWGIGVMLGPILGPTVGGYMTELYNWRWVFFVVAPFGVIALFGCLAFVPDTEREPGRRLDWFGFVALSVAVAATQLVFDRGQRLDWFESDEILLWAGARAARLLPVHRAQPDHGRAVSRHAHVPRPQLRGRADPDVRVRPLGVRAHGPDPDHARAPERLSRADDRPAAGAARHRQHDRADRLRPPGHLRRRRA